MFKKLMFGEEKRTYYDFSETERKDWLEQASKYPDVEYYYCKKNRAWCRKIRNVVGKCVNEYFYPLAGQLVSYRQAR